MHRHIASPVIASAALLLAASGLHAQEVALKIEVKQVAVDATIEAVDTGIRVFEGDTIQVSAAGNFKHHEQSNAWTHEGDSKKDKAGDAKFAFQDASPFALVGWIGEGKEDHFEAGANTSVQAKEGGILYLAINDHSGAYANNRGGLLATVVVKRNYRIAAATGDAKAAWGNPLVKVNPGDTLAVHADGTVTYWEGGDARDANGKDGNMETLLAPKLNQSALIAKIDDGEPFKVGKAFKQENSPKGGWVRLTVNDEIAKPDAYTNNSGKLTVNLYVDRKPAEFSNPIK